MTSYTIQVGSDADLGDRARAVRRTVFIEEQGVSEAEEMDDEDAAATQLLATTGDADPVGTARVRFVDDDTAKIERVAVLRSHRGEGLGSELMHAAEAHARDQGASTARLHGQVAVVEFYERLGYEIVGDRFEEAGIPHRKMVKSLA